MIFPEPSTRFTLDLNAVPMLKKLSHLPVLVDPSHGIGIAEGVPSMSMAAIAAGADGLILELHPNIQQWQNQMADNHSNQNYLKHLWRNSV
jgi:3-deoxy-7-phosphoheptulonate synthase